MVTGTRNEDLTNLARELLPGLENIEIRTTHYEPVLEYDRDELQINLVVGKGTPTLVVRVPDYLTEARPNAVRDAVERLCRTWVTRYQNNSP